MDMSPFTLQKQYQYISLRLCLFLVMEICDSLRLFLKTYLFRVYSSSVLFGQFIQTTLKPVTDQPT